ncbi:DUF1697 domain-containing protein [Sphingomonas nostoxanthinifaciens]|uniref:DUF1697 domain-containing protein n=1 Tax=Sphingomonas nostoxanthinifaciens TaxID=2872652 RepID=UPI001CC20512|nr:DUF1697 domain-containing protein [Sphingomonas nostoxanthinifaciens]
MATYVALLRAVNVGGMGERPMDRLVRCASKPVSPLLGSASPAATSWSRPIERAGDPDRVGGTALRVCR